MPAVASLCVRCSRRDDRPGPPPRKVRRRGCVDTILCCPEDVEMSTKCKHDASFVCQHCHIPFCNECYTLALQKKPIARCLANDNFIGYVHEYIVRQKVTRLEATIENLCHRCYGQCQNIAVSDAVEEILHVEFSAVMFWQLGEYGSIFPELVDETSP